MYAVLLQSTYEPYVEKSYVGTSGALRISKSSPAYRGTAVTLKVAFTNANLELRPKALTPGPVLGFLQSSGLE